jgi:hypothetical protein
MQEKKYPKNKPEPTGSLFLKRMKVILLSLALIFVLIANVSNLSYVLTFNQSGVTSLWDTSIGISGMGTLVGIIWAIGIESGVLLSVLAGAKKQAAILAIFVCAINLFANQVWEYPWYIGLAKFFTYGISSYLLWYFSEILSESFEEGLFRSRSLGLVGVSRTNMPVVKSDSTQYVIQEVEMQAGSLVTEVAEKPLNGNPVSAHQIVPDKTYNCPYCEREFSSRQALGGHTSRCEKRPQAQ